MTQDDTVYRYHALGMLFLSSKTKELLESGAQPLGGIHPALGWLRAASFYGPATTLKRATAVRDPTGIPSAMRLAATIAFETARPRWSTSPEMEARGTQGRPAQRVGGFRAAWWLGPSAKVAAHEASTLTPT